MRSSTSCALTGSSSFTITWTVGLVGFSPPSDWTWSAKSSGRISAASTSPSSTIARASSSESTSTHSTRPQSSPRAETGSTSDPPMLTSSSSGIWFRKATRGSLGPAESARPINTARAIG
jgi:hypothetical protein